jgi:hypothetical protein
MKNRCKNSKTILLNKNTQVYFENNYQQLIQGNQQLIVEIRSSQIGKWG